MKRRLAAILAADAVSFSAFAGRDEEAAIRALKGHIGAMEPVIGLHSGRIVKGTGDGFLAEFGSVVDAVSCADTAQKLMAERNAAQGEESRLLFRIGVHAGDIVIAGDDVLGDGVNIAARLEALAPPGGVAVSARVREDVEGKLDLAFTDTGLRELKNIARPVRVFTLGAAAALAPAPAPALPDKPSVAVLPFANMSAAAEDDYFADGVTEEITSALAHVPSLFVIARNSSFTYKGLNVDVREVGRALGVRYVLEGSVRRGGARLRVTGQLVDAETGKHIWAERFDGGVEDIFDLQDRIAGEVAAAIAPEIRSAEIARGLRKRPENLDAYDLYLRAQDALNRSRIEEAWELLAKAEEAAPGYAKAMALRAWLTTIGHMFGELTAEETHETGRRLARRALDLDGSDPEVAAYAGYAIGFLEAAHDQALRLLEETTARCPSFAWAWISSSFLSVYVGDAEAAIRKAETGLRLSPRDPLAFRAYIALCLAHVILADYGKVLDYSSRGLSMNPRASLMLRYRLLACQKLGMREEAEMARQRHEEIYPEFRISEYLTIARDNLKSDPRLWSAVVSALREAGFPE
ncbi:MAG: adenylate/guanylate cyclase domain-containing protein [Pikeienuella sp.]|uniref:adenylate/guanylate cyclase domain-containing protein n=1 Tax=Pikeienuella sp. TaxID=2831957 RepID=UPI00391C09C6